MHIRCLRLYAVVCAARVTQQLVADPYVSGCEHRPQGEVHACPFCTKPPEV